MLLPHSFSLWTWLWYPGLGSSTTFYLLLFSLAPLVQALRPETVTRSSQGPRLAQPGFALALLTFYFNFTGVEPEVKGCNMAQPESTFSPTFSLTSLQVLKISIAKGLQSSFISSSFAFLYGSSDPTPQEL